MSINSFHRIAARWRFCINRRDTVGPLAVRGSVSLPLKYLLLAQVTR